MIVFKQVGLKEKKSMSKERRENDIANNQVTATVINLWKHIIQSNLKAVIFFWDENPYHLVNVQELKLDLFCCQLSP